jgi:hypothetical protein
MATAKGHLDQSRQNFRSTKTKTNNDQPTIEIIETKEPNNQITNQAFASIEETGKVYTNQTGAFPTTSSNGNKYMLVMYHYDTNAILVEPLKTRHGNEILRGYQKLYTHLTNRGFKPTTHWLDNEASAALKEYNKSEQVDYQLVPPQVHQRNAAEREIRTWKNHLISGICSTDTNFPLHLWDRLLEQATITLNLLRPACRNTNMSAHQMLNGTFDYNRTPLAPPGTKILIHEKPNQWRSWDPHGVEGWYLGPATDHYRCYRVYVNKTRAERITDNVEFFPQEIEMPFPTPTEIAIEAAKALIHTLNDPIPSMPFAHQPYNRKQAIQTIADILKPYGSPELPTHVIEPEATGPPKRAHKPIGNRPIHHRGWQPQNPVVDLRGCHPP